MSELEPTRTYSNPTATEVIRRMLDERGVEWWEATPCKTKWNSPIIGGPVAAREWNGEMVLDTGYIAVTPEQAIAATLGTGTCHEVMINRHWRGCSECGYVWENMYAAGFQIGPNYCPMCGAKVVSNG